MKNEEFDHYIQSQFAGESIAPPQQIEGAIFEAIAKIERRKKFGRMAAGIMILGALAYGTSGVFSSGSAVHKESSVELPANTQQPSVDGEQDAMSLQRMDLQEKQPNALEDRTMKSPTAADSERVPPSSVATPKIQPKTIEPVAIRSAQPVDQGAHEIPVILQDVGEETWVLPATVEVKE